ncbi:proteasome subunit alpha [Saccharopolyspora dendranthemae]|uniref:Proteasome subunit alpha n=1 Tax=Saccharopolyspora dendranthemae TaxID=1181886 RepID=A0A561V9C6_9PSEU|nr:proteasome subunit alpha [Saccharopolyspora dendranthemae]TWG08207.1 proteasome alpha subunit [Saccharopolyspora dendranthemae]
MTMPFYTSPEQLMRERSELARKGIARGRSVVVLKYAGGVLFVAENPSPTLHKVSEIYDRIGFAAVGRYSEFEALRVAGVRIADVRGYSYDRRDVTGRSLANTYAQHLGAIFTEQIKPFEVEICVAEVGATAEADQLYRLTYDGSIVDEPQYVVMGGQADTITSSLKDSFSDGMELEDAIRVAVKGLSSSGDSGRELGTKALEVAVLDRARPNRTFRRIQGAALTALLPESTEDSGKSEDEETPSGK